MAEYRTIRMSFWSDPYIEGLSAEGKLLYIYLITCQNMNNLGVLETSCARIAYETGIAEGMVAPLLERLEGDGKIVRDGTYIWLANFVRNQCSTSPRLVQSLQELLEKLGSQKICSAASARYPHILALPPQRGKGLAAGRSREAPVCRASVLQQGRGTAACVPFPDGSEDGEADLPAEGMAERGLAPLRKAGISSSAHEDDVPREGHVWHGPSQSPGGTQVRSAFSAAAGLSAKADGAAEQAAAAGSGGVPAPACPAQAGRTLEGRRPGKAERQGRSGMPPQPACGLKGKADPALLPEGAPVMLSLCIGGELMAEKVGPAGSGTVFTGSREEEREGEKGTPDTNVPRKVPRAREGEAMEKRKGDAEQAALQMREHAHGAQEDLQGQQECSVTEGTGTKGSAEAAKKAGPVAGGPCTSPGTAGQACTAEGKAGEKTCVVHAFQRSSKGDGGEKSRRSDPGDSAEGGPGISGCIAPGRTAGGRPGSVFPGRDGEKQSLRIEREGALQRIGEMERSMAEKGVSCAMQDAPIPERERSRDGSSGPCLGTAEGAPAHGRCHGPDAAAKQSTAGGSTVAGSHGASPLPETWSAQGTGQHASRAAWPQPSGGYCAGSGRRGPEVRSGGTVMRASALQAHNDAVCRQLSMELSSTGWL